MFISIPIALSQVGLLDQEVKEGYVEASKEAVLNYIMLDQVFLCQSCSVNLDEIYLRRKESD